MNKIFKSVSEIKQSDLEELLIFPIRDAGRINNKETLEFFLALMLDKTITIPDDEKPTTLQILEARMQLYDFTFETPALLLFVFYIAESPGCGIMYLHYLQWWCKMNNKEVLTFEDFGMKIFPTGFPSDDTMHEIWYNSKITVGDTTRNLVDSIKPFNSER